MKKHLVFYDGSCGMCQGIIQFILKHDRKHHFVFAPLQGDTAKHLLASWRCSFPDADTFVLMENYQNFNKKISVFGKGALRLCWLLGGRWRLLGLISFLPAFLYDWIYKGVAKNRFYWFQKTCLINKNHDLNRFLP